VSGVVQVVALDRPIRVRRVEQGGDVVSLSPGEHETFTVRPHEKLEILGDEAEVTDE
jgi:hypothetical protein